MKDITETASNVTITKAGVQDVTFPNGVVVSDMYWREGTYRLHATEYALWANEDKGDVG